MRSLIDISCNVDLNFFFFCLLVCKNQNALFQEFKRNLTDDFKLKRIWSGFSEDVKNLKKQY